jgi:CRISPR-associated endonuclease/helicase Cas3
MSASAKVDTATLTADNFADYFARLHGHKPFPWQSRLAQQVIESGRWPDTLVLPTAAGKTAAIDVAVFALALDAQKPAAERRAPTRIFFVIDRRIVVDEAERRARLIAERLIDAQDGILHQVAMLLRGLSDAEIPLHVSKMRGGVFRDQSWARSPSQPTICLSTVDQLGSRLLYRGYGLRSRAYPIHAGLTAYDSLIILDEVHVARPFEQTLSATQRYALWAEQPLSRPLQVIRMSATAGAHNPGRFTLDNEDLEHPVLGKRLAARKLARFESTSDREGMIAAICGEVGEVLSDPRRQVLVIVVNRVGTARAIFERLRQRASHDAVLLTGRVRPYDRDDLLHEIMPRVRAGRDRSVGQRPLVVVATQCVEVGADFDFDALITECSPLDSLRQRLGRVDRLGELQESPVVVIANRTDLRDDRVYGDATAATWKWLSGKLPPKKRGKSRVLDLGTASRLYNGLSAEELETVAAPSLQAPVLLPAHLDLLSQTSPIPGADPDPALFLHGPEPGAPDVYFVWRAELDDIETDGWAHRVVLPPITDEALPLPIYAASAFLSGAPPTDVTDSESASEVIPTPARSRPALRWKGYDDTELIGAGELKPGDTLVVPCGYGGCDRFGWDPGFTGRTEDIADLATTKRRASAVMRLHPGLLDDPSAREALRNGLDAIEAGEPRGAVLDYIKSCLTAITTSEPSRSFAVALAAADFRWTVYPSSDGLLLEARRPPQSGEEDEATCTGRQITLAAHSEGVRDYVAQFATSLGLSAWLIDDLGLSGWLHDIGKVDPRCQVMLRRGDEGAFLNAVEPLAKSGMDRRDRRTWEAARELSGYPRSARHECQSVALALSNDSLLRRAHDPDLVLHLIASHHGCCRPFAPAIEDSAPVMVELQLDEFRLRASSANGLERLDSGVAERFWILVRRYGWFGLAFLEAILRLADHRRSEDEQREELT